MARPERQGLDYFSHDVDMSQDEKIQLVEADHGLIGYAVINKLLERIYRNSYFMDADEKIIKLFSRVNNIDVVVCNSIIKACINEKIFDKKLYDGYKILTSKGIQKRYLQAIKRRKLVIIAREYFLLNDVLDINVDINWINVNINPKNDSKGTQSKVKESKVKESKDIYGEFILLTSKEYEKLLKDYGESNLNKMIEKLDLYLGADKKRLIKYTSHNHVLRGWVADKLGVTKNGDKGKSIGHDNSFLRGIQELRDKGELD